MITRFGGTYTLVLDALIQKVSAWILGDGEWAKEFKHDPLVKVLNEVL